jgi:hypothetical protein
VTDYTKLSAGSFDRDISDPIIGGATVSLRIPRRGPMPEEKAWIIEHMGLPTRRVRDGKDNVVLHWDFLP